MNKEVQILFLENIFLMHILQPKGADRKHKTDREKMCKRLQGDKDKYHPQYEYTIFRDVSLILIILVIKFINY